jgi:hypothetical protein
VPLATAVEPDVVTFTVALGLVVVGLDAAVLPGPVAVTPVVAGDVASVLVTVG